MTEYKRSSETLPKMKLLGSVIVATSIAKNHEKTCVGQKCGCNSEEMLRWKNEMKNWEHDQASELILFGYRLNLEIFCRFI